jgi:hypothetical protein
MAIMLRLLTDALNGNKAAYEKLTWMAEIEASLLKKLTIKLFNWQKPPGYIGLESLKSLSKW